MSLPRRILMSLLVVGLAGACAGAGAWSAFSSSTSNPGNDFSAGTVAVGDNDAGAALLSLPATSRPGDATTGCIQVTYSGSLPSTVRLHGTTGGALAPYLTLTVTRGTQSSATFPSCTGFSADTGDHGHGANGVVYQGPLSGYPASYAAGIADPDGSWTTSEARAYRFQLTLGSDPAAQGQSGNATFRWEARNQ
jgi:hypothetical protein